MSVSEWDKIHSRLKEWNELSGRGLSTTKRLILKGPCISKKNSYRSRANGRIGLNADDRALLNAITMQARIQWGPLKPLEHPMMRVTFYVKDGRADRDNKTGGLLDCLQEAGVLLNDSISRFNGVVTIMPAIRTTGDEYVEVELEWFT
jgi:hypothetical protein